MTEKYCADCIHHLQNDGYVLNDPRYHSCRYKAKNGLIKRDLISKQYPIITCKEMREGECGKDGKLWEKK